MHAHRLLLRGLLPAALALCLCLPTEAKIGLNLQAPLGNPDEALTAASSRTKYLIQRGQFHLSYNDDTHQANWVSWSYSSPDSGSQSRTDAWAVEELLPSGYLRIGTSTFGTHFGVQWDRGHMTPSADRTTNYEDNAATFRMSNIIPQASKNNQGLWATFETYCRGLATGGNEVLIISGPSEFTGNIIPNSMQVPGSVWKIAVIIPNATSTTPANQRITTAARVIAIMTPNVSEGLGTWQSYITSVEEIEEVTGLNFFTAVDPSTAIYLKNLVDTGTGPNNPTVITTFSPTLGAPGTSVTISGYNFTSNSTVQFNGVEASVVTYTNPNQLVAAVPFGATTGPITADGPGGSDTSYEHFTVTTGSTTPTLSVTPTSLSGLSATEGTTGAALVYAVNGTNLTASVTVTAPTNFEISADGTNFASNLTLTPNIDGSLGTQLSVRIKSNASAGNTSGNISHASSGLITQNVAVSGTVTSTSPHITVSTANLTGFTALPGSAGASKSYTVSGANLTGSVTVAAPTGYEVSLDNSSFATTRILTPVSGTIANTTIHARLGAAAPLGSNTGSITHSGGSATIRNVSVSGSVTAPGSGESWIATSGTNTKGSINTGQSFTGKSGVWINEFHYDTASTDSGEFVEIVVGLEVTAALTNIVLVLYNGGDGKSYGTHALSTFTLGSTVNGYRIFHKDIAGLQNGAPDGLAVTVNGAVVQFLSYEGTFTASDGDAAGLTSTDIGVSETGAAIGSSLQLTGSVGSTTPAPVITVSGPATATALQSFTYQITASNSPDSYAASGLPDGLTTNTSTGLISGTPATPGTYAVGLTASNKGGDGTATLTINVQSNPNAPSITSDLITDGQINTAFSYQITAANSPTSYTAANLPAGLTINTSTGLISGTPTAGGTISTTITALNSFGSNSKTLQIIVRAPTLAITPAQLAPFTATAGFHSTTQSYMLSGSELTESITVRAPQYFEISTDGTTFASEAAISPAGNETLSQSITVRLTDSAPPGAVTGAVSHIGSGATPKYLEVSGTVSTTNPTLTISTSELAPFSAVAGTASIIQTYEVSGASLEGIVTITPPAGFEVGTDDESFGLAIELTPAVTGALTPSAIYVRLRDDAAAGSYAGVISHSGGGALPQTVTVSGTVAIPSGPNIVASSGGSTRVNSTYSYTILTDGAQTVTSYDATGLPTGLSISSSTGVISGTPTVAGTYNVTLRAASAQGTTSRPYTIRVITSAEQLLTPTVVINKYHNSTVDRVELLVAGDQVAGPPVDVRGMIIKDFNSNMATDGGGKYAFTDHPLWSNVKAGTLIVLAAGGTATEDVDPADWILRINLANATYFTEESGGFDIGNTDMIMVKPAGMQPDGTAGGLHVLAAGNTAAQYDNFNGPKTRARRALSANRGYYCYVVNGTNKIEDFSVDLGAEVSGSLNLGAAHTAGNSTFITTLRALDQDPPVITITGTNPVNLVVGESYTDAGATAFDVRDNASKTVTTSGSVNTAVADSYTIIYTATDNRGNIGTTTRTVNVLAAAMAPAIVATSSTTAISATAATLNGNVQDQGSSAVTVRGFVYSTVSITLETGTEGTVTATSGGGEGLFDAPLSALSPGATYYFRAFATNETGTSYGETLSFTTLKAEPINHATDFAAGTITTGNIAAAWTGTDADGYLLVVGAGVLTTPGDGVPVADDTDVSDGHGAINLPASATSFSSFTGFAPGTIYSFRLYPFNNSGSAINYKTGSAPTFTASVLTTPEISVSGSPAPLTTTYGTPSAASNFTVSGIYLTSTLSVAAPIGFEVSADNTTFANSVTLIPDSGTLAATAVYLRLAASAVTGGSYNARIITVSGGGAESVTLTTATDGHSVAAKTVTITGLTASNKTYDGTTGVTVAGSPAYNGLVNEESFPVTGTATWAFADKNIGENKTLVRTGEFSAPSANYTIDTQPSLTTSIKAKEVAITGAAVTTKVYDGTTAATITGATLAGVIDGDTVTVSGGGTFNNANAGENKPVTANLTLSGTDAANYTLAPPSLTGTIIKADQTITFAELPAKNFGDAPFALAATASSGSAVSYNSSNPAVATVSGSTVTILTPGTTTITAGQVGTANYNAATPVARDLLVTEAPTLLAGWDFQTTTTGGTAAASNNTPLVYQANFGSGSLHLDGANGSSAWITSTNSITNQVSGFAGTTLNTAPGFSTNTTSPSALALLAGASNSANNNSLVFKFGMAGKKDLAVSYATRGTSTGFTTHTWSYSTNATNWTEVSTQTGRTNSSFSAITLPVITNVDDAAEVYMRLVVTGATTSAGNNRLDNIQLVATDYIAPDTTPPVITLAGANPLYLPVGATFVEPGVSALDAIDGSVDVQTSGTVDTATRGTYVLTYTATDAAGNVTTETREVTVRSGATHAFETQYGLTSSNANFTADPDGDGVPNLMEYAFGSDPAAPDSKPASPRLIINAETVRFTATVRSNDPSLRVTPLINNDLIGTWSAQGVVEIDPVEQSDVPTGFLRRTWEVPDASADALFIRFEIGYD
ncbi:MAG: DNA/RNA non-specific endonuclease [Chthoniobacterales bacterium]